MGVGWTKKQKPKRTGVGNENRFGSYPKGYFREPYARVQTVPRDWSATMAGPFGYRAQRQEKGVGVASVRLNFSDVLRSRTPAGQVRKFYASAVYGKMMRDKWLPTSNATYLQFRGVSQHYNHVHWAMEPHEFLYIKPYVGRHRVDERTNRGPVEALGFDWPGSWARGFAADGGGIVGGRDGAGVRRVQGRDASEDVSTGCGEGAGVKIERVEIGEFGVINMWDETGQRFQYASRGVSGVLELGQVIWFPWKRFSVALFLPLAPGAHPWIVEVVESRV